MFKVFRNFVVAVSTLSGCEQLPLSKMVLAMRVLDKIRVYLGYLIALRLLLISIIKRLNST
jgi:hypothetical protein